MRKKVEGKKREQGADVRDEILESGSLDEPLFVLKPQRSRRLIGLLAFCIVLLGFMILVYALLPSFGDIGGLLALLGILIMMPTAVLAGEQVLFQEIRLYPDRITKSWRWVGITEIDLDAARFESRPHVLGGMKHIIRRGPKRIHQHFDNISYMEGMFDEEDIKTFHETLAELSGRKPAEF